MNKACSSSVVKRAEPYIYIYASNIFTKKVKSIYMAYFVDIDN